ncbi:MAG: glycosyl hydrolase 53 family protein [Bacilli bacterium]|nr:glycosyl hydrolase 53 family protein [Bacilli bacterium]
MKLGVDLSIMDELLPLGAKYFYSGKEVEPFSFFASHSGISMVRLRLWHNPYDDKGSPYGGGTNDLDCFLRLAKKAKDAGMSIMLDFHYSDFWVDPGRQRVPRAWEGKAFSEIVAILYEYTRKTLTKIKDEGIELAAIQVGNEVTNGMVFPYGKLWQECSENEGGGFKGFSELFKAGCRACREVFPSALIVCHVEHSASKELQDNFFTNFIAEGVDFDVIGESYYPYWHGTFRELEENIRNLQGKFHKPIWLVETGYEWGESLVEGHHNEFANEKGELFRVGNIEGRVPFPTTLQGQADYYKELLSRMKHIGVDMVFYWEPTWTLVPGNAWTKEAGQIYCGLVPGKAENDWANETLFDFDGNATPAIDVFTQSFVDSL